MKMTRSGIIFLFFAIAWSCGTTQKAADEVLPDWSRERPRTDFYYVGIAKVDKRTHPTDYQETAKRIALNDLASEISVKIQSNSILSSYENNNAFTSDYQQYIKTEINKELSGYEMVSNYESKTSYQVYYRLSKSRWAQIQATQKSNAAANSYHWYEQANQEKKQVNYTNAIQYYLNGLMEVKKYWSEPIFFKKDSISIQLDKALKTELTTVLEDLKIHVNTNLIVLNSKNQFSESIGISVKNKKGEYVQNIPLLVKYKKREIPYYTTFFSTHEDFKIAIEDVDFNKTDLACTVEFETSKLIKIASEDKSFLDFANQAVDSQPVQIPIEINLPTVYISSTSVGKYESTHMHFLKDAIKESIVKQNIKIANSLSESDYHIIITDHESKGPEDQKFKTVYFSYTLDVVNKSNKIVYNQSIPQVKGVDVSYEKATEKAYLKAAEEFKYQYSKKLIKGLLH